MIMTIVESGGKLPKGAAAAVFAMLGYVAAASIVAGLGDLGAGLLVLVMGGVAVGIVDYVMWRDVSRESGGQSRALGAYVFAGPETGDGPETPAVIHAFDPVRTEAAPAAAAAASPAPASSAQEAAVGPAEPANDAMAETSAAASTADSGAAEAAPEQKADAVGTRPPGLAAPRGAPDDLKRINGIGPTNEKKLNALGIYHLDQIAAWDDAQMRWVGAYLAFPGRIEREDWVGQARALAGSDAATA
jgi:predicted flap endonuclease-1-like 5' DNA nuclease